MLGIPTRGFDESIKGIAIQWAVGPGLAMDHTTRARFGNLECNLFLVVSRLIAAGYNRMLPPTAKVPLPSEQLMAQLRDVTVKFEQLHELINKDRGKSEGDPRTPPQPSVSPLDRTLELIPRSVLSSNLMRFLYEKPERQASLLDSCKKIYKSIDKRSRANARLLIKRLRLTLEARNAPLRLSVTRKPDSIRLIDREAT
jgi:hypothetical protein